MFILDSLFLSGFRWVLNTVTAAAEAEMNDDSSLRDQLLAAEMRRETGEISDEEFREIEADLLARIREIKTRREGGAGPIAFGGTPLETSPDTQFAIEASVAGDFHEPASLRADEPTNRRTREPANRRTRGPANRRARKPANARRVRSRKIRKS